MSTVETLHKFSRALALAVVALLVLAAAPASAQFGLYRAAVSQSATRTARATRRRDRTPMVFAYHGFRAQHGAVHHGIQRTAGVPT